ncbi:MAG: carboxypeptidase regulatory-like domain-containing protein [Clostridia bacterium]|nr:carboxypeptidase regulatory-like domain-containing protein [Clostridia bacterium]
MSANQYAVQKKKKSSNTTLIIIGAAIIAVVAAIAAVLLIISSVGGGAKSSEKYVDIAKKYIDAADYDNAIKSYWSAIEIAPTEVRNYEELGQLYEDQEEIQKACSVYHMGYLKTLDRGLYDKYQNLLLIVSDGEDKSAPVSSDLSLVLNNTLGSRFGEFTFREYRETYGAPQISVGSDGKYRVTYPNVRAEFIYYNTSADQYAIDAVNRKPRENRRPNDIILHDVSLLFPGMGDRITYEQLQRLNLDQLERTTASSLKLVVKFRIGNAQFSVECTDNGDILPNAQVEIAPVSTIPIIVTEVIETETTEESTATTVLTTVLTTAATTAPTTAPTTVPVREFTVSGTITSAVDGHAIDGVTVRVEATDGSRFSDSATTDGDGKFTLRSVPAGEYSLKAEKDGYITETKSFYVDESAASSDSGSVELNIVMSPELQRGEIRFVLTWNEVPRDLDAHLEGTSSGGSNIHVYFGNSSQSDSNGVVADLDYDDRDGFGPETLTLYDMGGNFEFYIFDYTESGTMGINGATVKIYADGQAPMEVSVPANVNNTWSVCRIRNGNIEITNTAVD